MNNLLNFIILQQLYTCSTGKLTLLNMVLLNLPRVNGGGLSSNTYSFGKSEQRALWATKCNHMKINIQQ